MYYLYLKTHNKTGLKYLGHTKKDPTKYLGSGVYWLKHLAIHGNDVSTEVIKTCYTKQEVKESGIYYSKLWCVVESDEWANLKLEEGDGGDTSASTAYIESRKKEEFKNKQSLLASGNTNVRGKKWWYNTITNEKKRSFETPGADWVNKCPCVITEEGRKKIQQATSRPKSVEHRKNLSIAAKRKVCNNKGTIWVVGEGGDRKRVKPYDIPKGYTAVKKLNQQRK